MINQRIFGASISDKVQEELNKRQSGTGEIEFGESVKIPQSIELNSRTPFIRMWTAVKLIEPIQVKDKLLQLNAAGEVSRDKALAMPAMEAIAGMHIATTSKKSTKKSKTFNTQGEAMQAYRRGEISLSDPVVIKN